MSDEQKEYEAMKLVNAMDKLMKTGNLTDCTLSFYLFTFSCCESHSVTSLECFDTLTFAKAMFRHVWQCLA
ncbi:unnamed protein product [Cylicostephanus goldi]|uniref:Uncharacterized protein n=1 Tax=Cylicostephanus goldi TaxID=71465 RepID=A0A3P7N2T5_CYLGO|nr:unnamed protein product [Cylicostephanus goldi]